MHKAIMINDSMFQQAMRGLEKGYSAEDFRVFSQCLDNMLDIHKLKGDEEEEEQEDYEVNDTMIDDNIKEMGEHFYKYVEAKKVYHQMKSDDSKAKSMQQLDYFMRAFTSMIMELVSSSDFQEERDVIKMKIKEVFSNI